MPQNSLLFRIKAGAEVVFATVASLNVHSTSIASPSCLPLQFITLQLSCTTNGITM